MKLDRLLRKLESKYDYGMLTDEDIIKITQKYFELYQYDTIIRDIANINRLKEYELDYIDYDKSDMNLINVNSDNELYNVVKEIIRDKIIDRSY